MYYNSLKIIWLNDLFKHGTSEDFSQSVSAWPLKPLSSLELNLKKRNHGKMCINGFIYQNSPSFFFFFFRFIISQLTGKHI